MRLDIYLVRQGYFTSRSQAQLAIKNQEVSVNKRIISKAGYDVSEADVVEYNKPDYLFVSRGGYKLLGAIENFHLDLKEKTVLDIGASTGGFSDCALQFGAKKVYAYDVGHDQLDAKIKEDKRVESKEGINCRDLKGSDFAEPIDFICMDVSFISCNKMFEAISSCLKDEGEAVILFKPQFEVGSKYLNRQGIVTSAKITLEKLNETIEYAKTFKLILQDQMISPIKGGDGNQEYLLYFVKK